MDCVTQKKFFLIEGPYHLFHDTFSMLIAQ